MKDLELINLINEQLTQNGLQDRISSDELRGVLKEIVKSKPNQDDIQNLSIGLIYQDPVDTKTKLPTGYTQAQTGYAVLVKDEGIIYQWNGTKWNSTGLTSFPSDVATKGGYEGTLKDVNKKINNYPYFYDQKGEHVPVLSRGLLNVCIDSEKIDTAKKHVIASLLRDTDGKSQISLYSINQDGSLNLVDRIEKSGDAADGTTQLLISPKNIFTVLIYWDVIPVGKYTEMKTGYDLHPLVFSKYNWLRSFLVQDIYPYKKGSNGSNIPTILKGLKDLFINPFYMVDDATYHIASIRKVTTQNINEIGIYYKNSSGAFVLVEKLKPDPNKINIQVIQGDKTSIAINWNEIPDNINYTTMSTGYELDSGVFSEYNRLFATIFEKIKVKNIEFTGGQVEITGLKMNTEKHSTRWLELKNTMISQVLVPIWHYVVMT